MAADQALEVALSSVLLSTGRKELKSECYNALEDIFLSCYLLAVQEVEEEEEDCIALTQAQILRQEDDNQLLVFLRGLQGQEPSQESVSDLLSRYGEGLHREAREPKEGGGPREAQRGEDQRRLGLGGFLQLVTDTASTEVPSFFLPG